MMGCTYIRFWTWHRWQFSVNEGYFPSIHMTFFALVIPTGIYVAFGRKWKFGWFKSEIGNGEGG